MMNNLNNLSNPTKMLFEHFWQPIAIADENQIILWQNKALTNLFNRNLVGVNSAELNELEISFKIVPFNDDSGNPNFYILPENRSLLNNQQNLKNAAHDFKNILTSITNSIELLKQKLKDQNELSFLIQNIESCTSRASDLIENLLPHKNKFATKHRVNLEKLVKELINALKNTLPHHIKLDFSIENNLSNIYCNSTEIYRSLLNICVNAREAIKCDGIIKIDAQNIRLASNNPEALPQGDFVKITISDNGSGIKTEDVENIFNQGFSTKIKNTESGLGLNIVKSFIESHNGKIFVESKLDIGTSFIIFLPAMQKRSSKNSSLSKKTILLADDEIIIRELLAELLESSNYNVIRAGDGSEALNKIKEDKSIDLIIIDRKMPILDGIECIAELKKMGLTTPIILASGSMMNEETKKLSDLKIDRILYKPYNFEEMKSIIEELIR